MKKIKLEIVGLSYSQTQTGAYALVLGEANGKRRLPIIIGGFEAQAIAIELEKMTPSRPLTHDLFKTFADAYAIKVTEVIIYNLVEGIFYAKIVCDNGVKEEEIDARTSDAIALAVRFGCEIYTHEFILSSAGIILEEDGTAKTGEKKAIDNTPPKSVKSKAELESEMLKALNDEDYEKAARLRDEISRMGES